MRSQLLDTLRAEQEQDQGADKGVREVLRQLDAAIEALEAQGGQGGQGGEKGQGL